MPYTLGWCHVESVAPCVDPFDKGAHIANGGVVNISQKHAAIPSAMLCDACYADILATPTPDPEALRGED